MLPEKPKTKLVDLLDLNEKETYLFENIESLNDKFTDLSNQFREVNKKTDDQTIMLGKILEQCTKTNGRVNELEKKDKDNEDYVGKLKFIVDLSRKKVFWIGCGVFFFIIIPYSVPFAPVLLETVVTKIFGS